MAKDNKARKLPTARPRRIGVAARRLNPVARFGLGEHVVQDDGKHDEPDHGHPEAQIADDDIADYQISQRRFDGQYR